MAWLVGYSYRKKITIDNLNIDTDLTNFPIKVILRSTNFDFSKALTTGYDVVFTYSDGTTLLSFERERYDSLNSKAEFHVKVPSVTSSVSTDIYMYYGKLEATDLQSANAVWDSNYVTVIHLGISVNDSTGKGNNGTAYGTTFVDTDYGMARSFDGIDDRVNIANKNPFAVTNSTQMALAMPQNAASSSGQRIWDIADWGGSCTWKTEANYGMYNSSNSWENVPFSPTGLNSIFTTFASKIGTGITGYINGVSQGTSGTGGGRTSLPYNNVNIGCSCISTQYFVGSIAEFRFSNIDRSNAWIKVEAIALKNGLLSLGSEEYNEPIITFGGSSLFFGMNF